MQRCSMVLSFPHQRDAKKLAAILRLLAQLVMSREKNAYLSATSALTIDGGKDKGRGR
jgi:hypothetical protein